MLDPIRIVLVEPQIAGNIGSTARSMKNMGLRRLILVRPPEDWLREAKIMAANALDVLRQAKVAASVREAVSDSVFIVGTTRRGGEVRSPLKLERRTAKLILDKSMLGKISILFGNERVGLSDRDLRDCHVNVYIPTSPVQPSLNLSHAVLLVAYEIFRASKVRRSVVIQKDNKKYLATDSDLDGMCRLLAPALMKLGYTNGAKRKHLGLLLKTIKQTMKRRACEIREVKMIEGIARRILDLGMEAQFQFQKK